MANCSKMAILAILVLVDMSIDMVNISVYAKNRKNVDNLQKGMGKNCIG